MTYQKVINLIELEKKKIYDEMKALNAPALSDPRAHATLLKLEGQALMCERLKQLVIRAEKD